MASSRSTCGSATWFYGFGDALPRVFIDIVISYAILAMGCLIAIQAMDVAFGPPGTAALKVAAIALAPAAISGFVAHLIGGTVGLWVGHIFYLICYFSLICYLFDMDMAEAFGSARFCSSFASSSRRS